MWTLFRFSLSLSRFLFFCHSRQVLVDFSPSVGLPLSKFTNCMLPIYWAGVQYLWLTFFKIRCWQSLLSFLSSKWPSRILLLCFIFIFYSSAEALHSHWFVEKSRKVCSPKSTFLPCVLLTLCFTGRAFAWAVFNVCSRQPCIEQPCWNCWSCFWSSR